MLYKKIGVIVADEDEYAPLRSLVEGTTEIKTPFKSAFEFSLNNTSVTAVLCGIGKVNAASCAMYLADLGCDCILSFGLSGGLKDVRRGDFILPDSFLEHDFDLTVLGYKPCEKPNQDYVYFADKSILKTLSGVPFLKKTGTAVCGDKFVSDKKTREFLIGEFSASSCDMETAAIASVCHITNIPFAAIRRISDDASDQAAESYNEMNTNGAFTLCDAFLKCLNAVCAEN